MLPALDSAVGARVRAADRIQAPVGGTPVVDGTHGPTLFGKAAHIRMAYLL